MGPKLAPPFRRRSGPQMPETAVPIHRLRTTCAIKHDGLGWKAGFFVPFPQFTLGVRTNQPSLIERLQRMFPSGMPQSGEKEVDFLLSLLVGEESKRKGVRNLHILYDGWSPAFRHECLEEALLAFDVAVRRYLVPTSKESTFLRADALRWNDKAIVVCGQDAREVATFSERLVVQGASHFSRGLTEISQEGQIKSFLDPELQPLGPGHILVLSAESANISPSPISPGSAAMAMLALAFSQGPAKSETITACTRCAMEADGLWSVNPKETKWRLSIQ